MFQNSFIVSIAQMVGVAFITSLSAYAYERLDFKGGNAIFWTLMYMSMFPNVVGILPLFRSSNALGWINNLNALIWPAMAGVFNIFLIRNFLKGVPKALDEAATIDGAHSFQVYLHIILPSILPVMIVVGLFTFNGAWNDFVWPTIVLTDVSNQTLTAGLRLLMGQYEQKWAHLIASCMVSMVPPFVLYLVAQKYFLRGISVQAGIKG
jgi:multiple sugar transport system permease protein